MNSFFKKDLERCKGAYFKSEFITLIYNGETIAQACAALRVNPGALAFARRDDMQFDQEIRAAQAFRVDIMTDRLENIDEYIEDAVMAGVVSKNIQWLASKRLREIYGDKIDINHNVTIDITAALESARQRTLDYIDVKPLEITDNSTDNVSVELIEFAEDIDPLS